MRVLLFFIISLEVFATSKYDILEKKHSEAVELWEIGNNEKAFDIFKENSEKDYAASMFYLGLYYLYGFDTVKISYNNAFYYINRAADKGYINAELQRIIFYYYGIGMPKDRGVSKATFRGIEPYTHLLNQKSKSYMLILVSLKKGFKNKKNKYRIKLLKKILKSKHRLAIINLIFFYRTYPSYLKYNSYKAKSLIKNEIKKGNSEAQALYYEEYYKYLKKSIAFKYLLKAGIQGDVNSQYNLYLYYLRKKNNEKKMFWLEKAAKSGDSLAKKHLRKLKDYK